MCHALHHNLQRHDEGRTQSSLHHLGADHVFVGASVVNEILATRMAGVAPSPSMLAMSEIARLRGLGHDVLSLTIGEPDLPTPAHVIDAAMDSLRSGRQGYTPTNGIPALREAVRSAFKAAGADVAGADIAVGSGAKQLIFAAFAATVDPGDEVIVPAPYWVSYPEIVRLFGGVPKIVACPRDSGYKLTAAALAEALTERTRWIVLNSPSNPTGAVYSQDELAAIGEVLREHQCMILSDEIYEHIVFDGRRNVTFTRACPNLSNRSLTLNGVSKAYSMTGFRLGYGIGPDWLIEAINTVLTQDTSCATSISQVAAVAALNGDQSFLEMNRSVYETRRDRFLTRLNSLPGISCLVPAGAFYAFASVEGLIGAEAPDGSRIGCEGDVVSYLLRDALVATIAGSAFGMANHIRFSFAVDTTVLDAACDAMERSINKLRFAT